MAAHLEVAMRLTVLLAAIVCSAMPVQAQPARKLELVLLLEGVCTKLQALSADITADCNGKMTRDMFSDGRTGFTFYIKGQGKEPVILTFTGLASKEVIQNGGVATQPIDGLLMTVGSKPINGKAVGLCRYGKFFKPNGFVDCSAEVTEGRFEGRFQQNATPPVALKGRPIR